MPLPSTPKPRQRRRWPWVLLALLLAFVSAGGWQVCATRRAIRQLEDAGFMLEKRDSMWVWARRDWRNLLKPGIWTSSLECRVVAKDRAPAAEKRVQLRNFDALAPALSQLNPDSIYLEGIGLPALENLDALRGITSLSRIRIYGCRALRNLEGLKSLPRLRCLELNRCRALPNIDVLKELTALEHLYLGECFALHNADAFQRLINLKTLNLEYCPALENWDALKGLPKLKKIDLNSCPKLSKESIAALKAALPNTDFQVD